MKERIIQQGLCQNDIFTLFDKLLSGGDISNDHEIQRTNGWLTGEAPWGTAAL
jgi:hypothetical protein